MTRQQNLFYGNGQVIAQQVNNDVQYEHVTPAGTGKYSTSSSGVSRTELDPVGADVGLSAPLTDDTGGGAGDIGGNHSGGNLMSRFGDLYNPSGGCLIDGLSGPCSLGMAMVNSGAATAEDPYESTRYVWRQGKKPTSVPGIIHESIHEAPKFSMSAGYGPVSIQEQQGSKQDQDPDPMTVKIDPADVIRIYIDGKKWQNDLENILIGPDGFIKMFERSYHEIKDGRPTIENIRSFRARELQIRVEERKVGLQNCLEIAAEESRAESVATATYYSRPQIPGLTDILTGIGNNKAWGGSLGAAAGNFGTGVLMSQGVRGYLSVFTFGEHASARDQKCHDEHGY